MYILSLQATALHSVLIILPLHSDFITIDVNIEDLRAFISETTLFYDDESLDILAMQVTKDGDVSAFQYSV